jgi:20S proteasome subunit beta 7
MFQRLFADYKVLKYFYQCFSFLGYVDRLGIAYESPTVATGYGAYIAQVLVTQRDN